MGVAGKNSPTARRNATDLKALLPLITTIRRTKIFVYGFVVTFIICTAFLAFSPSTNVFSSLCTSPFQVSNFVLYFFPNSSSSALPEIQNPVQKPQIQVGSSGNEVWSSGNEVGSSVNEVRSSGNEVLGSGLDGDRAKKGSSDGFMSEKNETESEIDMHGVLVENEAVKAIGHKNDEVLVGKNGVPGIQETRTPAWENQTVEGIGSPENGVPAKNQTGSQETKIPEVKNQTVEGAGSPENRVSAMVPTPKIEVLKRNKTAEGVKKSMSPAAAPSPAVVAYSNSAAPALSNGGRKSGNSIDKLMGCDIFDGRWVHDDSYPLYPAGSCSHIDEPFDCYRNGRPDKAFLKYRWQPNGCNIPRMNATDMLERLRGKRLVFVGDSLNRNMWESLVCVLANSVKDKSKVFEASGKREFRTEGAYSFVFKDYGCSVEFFRSPFLVREWEMPDKNGSKRETLRLDVIDKSTSRYKDAYAIIFNTGHWWTHEKTSQGKDYYQEGNHVYNVLNVDDAFHKALSTWARWIDANVNPKRTHVFFRGYSASHFSGGQWNSGGQCDRETDPIENDNYLARYPQKMNILEEVIKGMKTPVAYMNITRMTDYRKDGHPSFYRKPNTTAEERAPDKIQDCSHWCLPGVPDAWNELLYAQLLIKQQRMQH